ncbi:hypothetical protein, partial [Escherichia coli]|uniref:hypothetical protein n=1 Tax=Escherichia coli TaxID=562 RepID=UPI001BAF330C
LNNIKSRSPIISSIMIIMQSMSVNIKYATGAKKTLNMLMNSPKNLGSKPVVQAIQCLIRKLEIINETPVHNIITTLPRIPFHIREVINLTLLYTSHKNEILSTNIVKYVKDEISIPKTIKNIVVAKIPIAPIWRRKLLTTVNL